MPGLELDAALRDQLMLGFVIVVVVGIVVGILAERWSNDDPEG